MNDENNEEEESFEEQRNAAPKQISKHKQLGKHKLAHDSIFKGKKEELCEEEYTGVYFDESFEHDPRTMYFEETFNNQDYLRTKLLKDRVFDILSERTELNFGNNRRKPSRVDFNTYYSILRNELDEHKFTYIEIFNELAFYFSDNLLNMLKLLDNKWRNMIINELTVHVGKMPANWNKILPKNLIDGNEIEFVIEVETQPGELSTMILNDTTGTETLIINGIITDSNHDTGEYTVNSFEDIYVVPIECITKILTNVKYKFNINQLANLDIL